jgi:hypothetical protein
VEGNVVVLQQLQTAHGCPVAAVASPRFAVQVVKKIGTVDAESHANVVPLDEVAPPLVQQGAVGLNGMNDIHSARGGLARWLRALLRTTKSAPPMVLPHAR